MQSARPSFDPISVITGSWTMRATSLPMWLSGLTQAPHYTFSLDGDRPDSIAETLTYLAHNAQAVIIETSHALDGERFVSRGTGLARFSRTKWSVSGVSADAAVIVLRFTRTRLSPEGVSILVRDGAERPRLRAEVASDIDAFGLALEEFASITWFNPATFNETARSETARNESAHNEVTHN
jgi:hypothetical protein